MQFNLYLSLDGTDQCATITVPATMHLEDLTIRIQMALRLPFTDEGWHQFRAFGRVYMPEANICAEEEIRGECDLPYISIRQTGMVAFYPLNLDYPRFQKTSFCIR